MTETLTASQRTDHIRSLLPEIADIADISLRSAVESIWEEMWSQSGWEELADIPVSPSAADAPRRVPDAWTLITHTRAVARLALTSAQTIKTLHGIPYDRDALLAVALLHDVSKIIEFEGTKDNSQVSPTGKLIQHGVYGAFLMWQHKLPAELVHGVVAHTPYSRTLPRTHEALIVRYADFLDSDSMLLDAGHELHLRLSGKA